MKHIVLSEIETIRREIGNSFSFLFFFLFLFRFIEGILSIQGGENGGNVASDPVKREKSSQ